MIHVNSYVKVLPDCIVLYIILFDIKLEVIFVNKLFRWKQEFKIGKSKSYKSILCVFFMFLFYNIYFNYFEEK